MPRNQGDQAASPGRWRGRCGGGAASARELSIAYLHQKGHQAIGYDEFAGYNARADALATQGAMTDGSGRS